MDSWQIITQHWPVLNDLITLILAVWALIISIVTLRISKKISFKKNIKERQLEVITELLNGIKNTRVICFCTGPAAGGAYPFTLDTLFQSNFKNIRKDIFGRKNFYFMDNYIDKWTFVNLSDEKYMPEKIKFYLKQLHLPMFTYITYQEILATGDFVCLLGRGKDFQTATYYYCDIEGYKTLESYRDIFIELIKSINDWLYDHDADELIIPKVAVKFN